MCSKIAQKGEIRFRPYAQDIVIDLPVHLQELVSDNALAQLINELVEGLCLQELSSYYSSQGSPAYDPRMLLKVWLYGYCTKVYTSRSLAKKLREDLVFIWLAGGQRPCFKTLSSFRSKRMQDIVDVVVSQVLLYLIEQGYVDLSDLYVDGSKWEANANKYKIVWRKNTERYKGWVLDRITGLLQQWQALQEQEDQIYGRKDLVEHQSPDQIQLVMNSSDLAARLVGLNKLIAQQKDKTRKGKLEKIHRQLSKEQTKLIKYEAQQSVLAGRNSYSKTDHDATAMRMKDERLLPGYNAQITTSKQFIINATLHQTSSDSTTLMPHVASLEQRVEGAVNSDWCPDYTADAGYGSEENYDLLDNRGYTAYVKYPSWYQEHTGQLSKKRFNSYNWFYDPEQDCYLCPNQKQLHYKEHILKKSRNGYLRQLKVYQCQSCAGCPLFDQCRGAQAKPGSNRRIFISEKLEAYKEQVRKRLASEVGKTKRSQRSVEVETPFANIKYNMGHRRFLLRGLDKVSVEFLLLTLAHNINKIYCLQSGLWKEYYAQRANRKAQKTKKRA